MLTICLSEYELYDEYNNKFHTYPSINVDLEHSLVSLYKWEAKWHTPFLNVKEFTTEQYLFYIKCMILNTPSEPTFINGLTQDNIKEIQTYIADPMTATVVSEHSKKETSFIKKSIATAEVIYAQMIANNIPFECQHWHLNQLICLINTCDAKNNPKKLSKQEVIQRNSEINTQRKAKYNSKG